MTLTLSRMAMPGTAACFERPRGVEAQLVINAKDTITLAGTQVRPQAPARGTGLYGCPLSAVSA